MLRAPPTACRLCTLTRRITAPRRKRPSLFSGTDTSWCASSLTAGLQVDYLTALLTRRTAPCTQRCKGKQGVRPIRTSMEKACMAMSKFDVDSHVPPHHFHNQFNNSAAVEKTCHFVVSSSRISPSHSADQTTGTPFKPFRLHLSPTCSLRSLLLGCRWPLAPASSPHPHRMSPSLPQKPCRNRTRTT